MWRWQVGPRRWCHGHCMGGIPEAHLNKTEARAVTKAERFILPGSIKEIRGGKFLKESVAKSQVALVVPKTILLIWIAEAKRHNLRILVHTSTRSCSNCIKTGIMRRFGARKTSANPGEPLELTNSGCRTTRSFSLSHPLRCCPSSLVKYCRNSSATMAWQSSRTFCEHSVNYAAYAAIHKSQGCATPGLQALSQEPKGVGKKDKTEANSSCIKDKFSLENPTLSMTLLM